MATCDFYGDFLLLDPCDAPAVFEFLQGKCSGKENNVAHQGSPAPSKNRPSMFTPPIGRSGGTGRKLAPGKVQEDLDPTQESPGQSQMQIKLKIIPMQAATDGLILLTMAFQVITYHLTHMI